MIWKKLFTLSLASLLLLELSFPTRCYAQATSDDELVKETMDDVLTVVGTGAAGAVLGLSTLSFVDNPSKHIRNVMVGAAFGIIFGVIFVAYSQAGRADQYLQGSYSPMEKIDLKEFGTMSRIRWHHRSQSEHQVNTQASQVAWSFSF